MSVPNSAIDIASVWFELRSGAKRLDDFPEEVLREATQVSSLSHSELQAFFDKGVRLEKSSAKVGRKAPEFRLHGIDDQGNRTGEMVQLSETLDKPVALVFGSYT
jgi:hypothetical protein